MRLRIHVGSFSYDVIIENDNLRRPEQAPIEASERAVLRGKPRNAQVRAEHVIVERVDE